MLQCYLKKQRNTKRKRTLPYSSCRRGKKLCDLKEFEAIKMFLLTSPLVDHITGTQRRLQMGTFQAYGFGSHKEHHHMCKWAGGGRSDHQNDQTAKPHCHLQKSYQQTSSQVRSLHWVDWGRTIKN